MMPTCPRPLAEKILIAALAALMMLASAQLAAQPTYTSVYRADPRPPAEVFQYGFSSEGRQLSLLEHVFGDACDAATLDDRSAWVSTTGSFESARNFAFRSLRNGQTLPGAEGHARVWIYEIQPDASYLEVNSVFRQMIDEGLQEQQNYLTVHARRMRTLLRSIAAQERNDVLTRRVAPENILRARAFTAHFDDDGTGWNISESLPASPNPNFRHPTSVMTNRVDDMQSLVPGHNLFHYAMQAASCSQACDGARASSSMRLKRSALLGGLSCAANASSAQALIGSED